MRTGNKVLVDELRGLTLLALENQATHLGQDSQRLLGVIVVRLSAPEGLFVQLDFLYVGAAIDHGAQVGVAYGQGLQPMAGGLGVPHTVGLCADGHTGHGQQQGGQKSFLHRFIS